jgi:hypothetical protein
MKMLEEHQTNVTLPTPMYANRTVMILVWIAVLARIGFVFKNSCTEKQGFSYKWRLTLFPSNMSVICQLLINND